MKGPERPPRPRSRRGLQVPACNATSQKAPLFPARGGPASVGGARGAPLREAPECVHGLQGLGAGGLGRVAGPGGSSRRSGPDAGPRAGGEVGTDVPLEGSPVRPAPARRRPVPRRGTRCSAAGFKGWPEPRGPGDRSLPREGVSGAASPAVGPSPDMNGGQAKARLLQVGPKRPLADGKQPVREPRF